MQLYDMFLLAGLFFIGALTSYEDMKEGKIRNKWVVVGLLYSLAVTLAFVADSFVRQKAFPIAFLSGYFLNIFLIFVLGIILWKLSFWTAADAKLATSYAALLPLPLYSGEVPYAPFTIVLLNTFIVAFASLFIALMISTTTKEKTSAIKHAINPKSLFDSALFVFGFSWVAKLLLALSGIGQSIFTTLMIVLLFLLVTKQFKFDYLPWATVLSVLHLIFQFSTIFTFSYLSGFTVLFGSFIIITKFVMVLSAKRFGEEDVLESVPFAPILFAGTVLTLAVKGNLFAFISRAIESFL